MIDTLDSNTVAQYLADNPHFFEEHAGLLGQVRLASPITGRAISLQERQMEVMREKYRTLELHMSDLVRLAQENAAIANRFHGWTQSLLRARVDGELPRVLVDSLKASFNVPQATLRLWGMDEEHAEAWFTQGVSEDARLFAASLHAPYCGSNNDFEAVRWLDDAAAVQSTVIMPLRADDAVFGLLILGSEDPERFTAGMGTDFLVHIGDTASAALAPLRA